jgi:hypothetical protein
MQLNDSAYRRTRPGIGEKRVPPRVRRRPLSRWKADFGRRAPVAPRAPVKGGRLRTRCSYRPMSSHLPDEEVAGQPHPQGPPTAPDRNARAVSSMPAERLTNAPSATHRLPIGAFSPRRTSTPHRLALDIGAFARDGWRIARSDDRDVAKGVGHGQSRRATNAIVRAMHGFRALRAFSATASKTRANGKAGPGHSGVAVTTGRFGSGGLRLSLSGIRMRSPPA